MTIILTILKIIGMAILWIIAVLIVLILVILVCPIYYEIKGEKYDKLSIQGKVKLFLGAVSVRFRYANDEEIDAGLYLFGIKLGNNKEKKVKKKKTKKRKKLSDEDKNLVAAEMSGRYKPDVKPNLEQPVNDTVIEQEKNVEEKVNTVDLEKEVWLNKNPNFNEPLVRKVKLSDSEKTLRENKDTSKIPVKRIKIPEEEKKKKEKENKEAEANADKSKKNKDESSKERQQLNVAYFLKMPKEERKILIKAVLRLLKSLLRGIKPNNFYLIGTVGLTDPALTGEIVGAAWALNGILNKRIEISTAFDREVIEGEVYIKGNIVPAYMLFCFIRFALVKPVRKIIKMLLKGSGDKNGKRNRK